MSGIFAYQRPTKKHFDILLQTSSEKNLIFKKIRAVYFFWDKSRQNSPALRRKEQTVRVIPLRIK
jgi:hypothetical protein